MFKIQVLVKKFLRLLNSSQKSNLLVLIILMFIGGIIEALGIGLILPIIYFAADSSKLPDFEIVSFLLKFFRISNDSLLLLLIFGLLLFYVFKIAFLTFLTWEQNGFISELQRNLTSRLFEGYLKMPYSFHISRNSNELMHNVRNLVIQFCSSVLSILVLMAESITLVGIAILLFSVDPFGSFFLFFLFVVFSSILSRVTNAKINSWGVEQNLHDEKRMFFLQQGLTGIKEIKTAGIEQKFIDNYNLSNYIHTRVGQKFQTIQAIPRLILELILLIAVLSLVAILKFRKFDSLYIVSELSIFAAAAFRILPSLNKIINSLQNLKFTENYLNQLNQELSNSESYIIKSECINVNSWDNLRTMSIHIKEFCYEGTNKIILKNLDLNIFKGDSIGIIGESGAGKSSLLDIIMGLHILEYGNVMVNDIGIVSNIVEWQKKIGYVPQSVFLLDDTIVNNILFNNSDDILDQGALNDAIRLANLTDFISNLEFGLDTKVGEGGIRLSGGQKQRIGIARALYRKPELLILDESTSALDVDTEEKVINSIEGLFGKKTFIIVSHRLSAIRKCNRVFKISKGSLVEFKIK